MSKIEYILYRDRFRSLICRKKGFVVIQQSSRLEIFLEKVALKICTKFTGEHPCRNVISIKLICIFIQITLQHGCSPGNLLHIFRAPFSNSTSGWLLLYTTWVLLLLLSFVTPVDRLDHFFIWSHFQSFLLTREFSIRAISPM